MTPSTTDREQRALRYSLLATALLAVVAVLWGWIVGSQVILLDGAYAGIGLALTWLSLRVSGLASSGPTARFPFGREALIPVVIALQGFALLATLIWAGVEAVRVIRTGGSDPATGSLLVYGVISGLVSVLLGVYCLRADRSSDLLAAEARQWLAGAVFSGLVVAGALVAAVLGRTDWSSADRYVDSVLVLAGCALLTPQPVILVRSALTELLEGAPPERVQRVVGAVVEEVRERFGLPEPHLMSSSKVGRKLYVEVVFVVVPGRWDVSGEDEVRRAVLAGLAELPYESWIRVELTTDRALA